MPARRCSVGTGTTLGPDPRTLDAGGFAISTATFQAIAGSWHDFYLTAGTAAATLVGLLFVGLSINLDAVTADDGTGLRLLAEQAFSSFVYVLLIALFVLVPTEDAPSFALELVIIGAIGLFRVGRRAITYARRGDRFGRTAYLARRLGLPALASLGLLLVAGLMLRDPLGAFFWLLAVVLIFLMSAADASWDLLVEVGRERRQGH